MQKTEMDIERLLQWAFVDELSKKQTSAAEGIWDRIFENQHHGGIDCGYSAAQRYAHFGLPDPEVEAIERAVAQLEDVVIDWEQSFDAIAGALGELVSMNDFSQRQDRCDSTRRALAGQGIGLLRFFGPAPIGRAPRQAACRPDGRGLKTSVLLTTSRVPGRTGGTSTGRLPAAQTRRSSANVAVRTA